MWQGKQFLEIFLRFSSKPLLICFSFMNEMIWILFVFTGNFGNSVRSFLSCSLRYPANNVSSVTTSLFCDFSYKFHDSSRRSQLVTPVFHLLVCTFTESLASRIEVRCLLLSWLMLSFRFFCDGSVDNFGFFPPLCIIFFTTDTRAPHRTAPCTWFWSMLIAGNHYE